MRLFMAVSCVLLMFGCSEDPPPVPIDYRPTETASSQKADRKTALKVEMVSKYMASKNHGRLEFKLLNTTDKPLKYVDIHVEVFDETTKKVNERTITFANQKPMTPWWEPCHMGDTHIDQMRYFSVHITRVLDESEKDLTDGFYLDVGPFEHKHLTARAQKKPDDPDGEAGGPDKDTPGSDGKESDHSNTPGGSEQHGDETEEKAADNAAK